MVVVPFEGIMATAKRLPQFGIGARIGNWRRKALRMSRKLLALRSGVSLPTVTRIVRNGGEHATYANLTAVARRLEWTSN